MLFHAWLIPYWAPPPPIRITAAAGYRKHADLNTLRPRQNGRHFADDIFKRIFVNEHRWIAIKISLKFVPNGLINNIPALVQILAWRRRGDRPLSEPMMVNLPTHIFVTRPQWVKASQAFSRDLSPFIQNSLSQIIEIFHLTECKPWFVPNVFCVVAVGEFAVGEKRWPPWHHYET